MDHSEHCDALEGEIQRISSGFGAWGPDPEVASCPGWNVGEVIEHLGRIHRWAEELVRRRVRQRISTAAIDLAPGEVTPQWLTDGGSDLVATLRGADPDRAMWAWGADQHVRFWSRRQLHETMVHRMDIELAGGVEPTAPTDQATDGVDEFLANLAFAAHFSPNVLELRGTGERLAFRATDSGASWSVRLNPDGFEWLAGEYGADAEIAGPAVELLLALYRRRPLGERVEVRGDTSVADFWITHSALQ